jgi:hypothetical protein
MQVFGGAVLQPIRAQQAHAAGLWPMVPPARAADGLLPLRLPSGHVGCGLRAGRAAAAAAVVPWRV